MKQSVFSVYSKCASCWEMIGDKHRVSDGIIELDDLQKQDGFPIVYWDTRHNRDANVLQIDTINK